MSSLKNISTRATSQRAPVAGKNQIRNNAGGYVFSIDSFAQLERFLILGTSGGTYYVGEAELTEENYAALVACVKADPIRTVNTIVSISTNGRAPKNDYALFALAYTAAHADEYGRRYALFKLRDVARTATHLFQFVGFAQQFRGWGRTLKRAVAEWYNTKDPGQLAYQVVKYPQREGFSHRDVLRLSHPSPPTDRHDSIFAYATKGTLPLGIDDLPLIAAAEAAKAETNPKRAAQLVRDHHGITREMLNTEVLKSAEVWEALLEDMPITAMIRNLGVMSNRELITPFSDAARTVAERLRDRDRIIKGRVHPITILTAMETYKAGQGWRGNLTWDVTASIVDALDDAFYIAFDTVEPANKRTMLALDVSGSMGAPLYSLPWVSARVGSAAMAMVTARTEPEHMFTAFTGKGFGIWGRRHAQSTDALSVLNVSPRQRLDDVIRTVDRLDFGATDCALPMLYATEKGLQIDTFVVYTDNETWAGDIQPYQALEQYRQKSGIPARLVVVGMTATEFSIADPDDDGMLDCVGFDTAAPNIINAFSRGDF